jgi:hypothetical protein
LRNAHIHTMGSRYLAEQLDACSKEELKMFMTEASENRATATRLCERRKEVLQPDRADSKVERRREMDRCIGCWWSGGGKQR